MSNSVFSTAAKAFWRFVGSVIILFLIWAAIWKICSLGTGKWDYVQDAHCLPYSTQEDLRETDGASGNASTDGKGGTANPTSARYLTVHRDHDVAWQGAFVIVILPLAGLAAGTVCTVAFLRKDS